jgi:uncharacterized membrane protein
MTVQQGDEPPAGDIGLSRLLTLTDGVFAIALTLLVLGLAVPANLSGDALDRAFDELRAGGYAAALSFFVIGVFWMGHHRMFRVIDRCDDRLLALNLAFLAPVVLMPFATQLIADYGDRPGTTATYAAIISVAAIAQFGLWMYATHRRRLVPADTPQHVVVDGMLEAIAAAMVFSVSIPLAYVSPSLARASWVVLTLVVSIAFRTVPHRWRR